jgi:hypothetical protein
MELLVLIFLVAIIAWALMTVRPGCKSNEGMHWDCGCGAAFKKALAHHGNKPAADLANAQCMVGCHGSSIDQCGCVSQYNSNVASGMSLSQAQQKFWTCYNTVQGNDCKYKGQPGCLACNKYLTADVKAY